MTLYPFAAGLAAFFIAFVWLAIFFQPYELTKQRKRAIIVLSLAAGLFVFLLNL